MKQILEGLGGKIAVTGTRRVRHAKQGPVRGAARGALLGFLVVGTAVAFLAWSAGLALGEALILGLFVAMWGGFGFGAMLGATVAQGHDTESPAGPATQHDASVTHSESRKHGTNEASASSSKSGI